MEQNIDLLNENILKLTEVLTHAQQNQEFYPVQPEKLGLLAVIKIGSLKSTIPHHVLPKCNTCKIQQDQNIEEIEEFIDEERKLQRVNASQSRVYDIFKINVKLYQALLFPERFKHVRLPSTFFTPTYTFQQKSSFWVHFLFKKYLY
jgi:hypothetical protein